MKQTFFKRKRKRRINNFNPLSINDEIIKNVTKQIADVDGHHIRQNRGVCVFYKWVLANTDNSVKHVKRISVKITGDGTPGSSVELWVTKLDNI